MEVIIPILILIYLIIRDAIRLPGRYETESQIDRLETRLIRLGDKLDKLAATPDKSKWEHPKQTTNKGWRRQGSEL